MSQTTFSAGKRKKQLYGPIQKHKYLDHETILFIAVDCTFFYHNGQSPNIPAAIQRIISTERYRRATAIASAMAKTQQGKP
jgi:hypothetical protein